MGFVGKMKKEFKLMKIMGVLSQQAGPDDFLARIKSGRTDPKDQALQDLLDVCCSDQNTRSVMSSFNLDRDGLKDLYLQLIMAGAGLRVRNTWVAAGAIADARVLDYVLRAFNEPLADGMDEHTRRDLVVAHLVDLYARS